MKGGKALASLVALAFKPLKCSFIQKMLECCHVHLGSNVNEHVCWI